MGLEFFAFFYMTTKTKCIYWNKLQFSTHRYNYTNGHPTLAKRTPSIYHPYRIGYILFPHTMYIVQWNLEHIVYSPLYNVVYVKCCMYNVLSQSSLCNFQLLLHRWN